MKKTWIGFSLMAIALAGSALWMSQGCVGKIPTFATVVATSTAVLPSDYIANFENGNAQMNPYLTNSVGGFFADLAYPSYNKINPVVGSNVPGPFIVLNPGNGSQFAIHIFGVLTDPGDGSTYPDFDVKGYFNADCPTCYYDASSFTGIQFDYYWPNITVNGHAPPPIFWFDLSTARTAPQGQGGLCDSQTAPSGVPCYDHLAINLPHNVAWGTVSRNFTALTNEYGGYGWQAADAQKFLYLEFRTTANNAKGVYNVDFRVDNIKFLP